MAVSQLAAKIEQFIGHGDNNITEQDITNPARDRAKYGHPTETMLALTWQGKNTVKVGQSNIYPFFPLRVCTLTTFKETVPKPIVVEDRDVILKVTGTTVCGSDLHLLHGSVIQLEKGDILGHEFCGVVDSIGSAVKKVKVGERVVASFQIACGDV